MLMCVDLSGAHICFFLWNNSLVFVNITITQSDWLRFNKLLDKVQFFTR